jgi:saccharopine dehydrogenase-like NADP-dependent oxidoreductase
MGVGAMGARCARQLVSTPSVSSVVLRDPDHGRTVEVQASLSETSIADSSGIDDPVDADVVVLAGPAGTQLPAARLHLGRGAHIVTTSDDVDEVRGLLALNDEAVELDRTVVVGAGFAPGLTDLLARHAAERFTEVNEVHVGKVGTGGPACAQAHHRALAGMAVDWRDGQWLHRQGGSGRELAWFPDPIAARDCYRAALPDALLLAPEFPGVSRVTARLAATRRDRLTARLPMLRRPHLDGGPGAVRVEVRGMTANGHDVVVLGAMDRPAVAGGAVAALAAVFVGDGRALRSGAAGMAGLFDPLPLLVELAGRGVRCAVFDPQATLIT